ncbi:hypothetical protein FQA39_LY09655 [Lamprigera yunnana]|nr:hypothetical protein FQA39_LY09655 [Lamprigera yunnana]
MQKRIKTNQIPLQPEPFSDGSSSEKWLPSASDENDDKKYESDEVSEEAGVKPKTTAQNEKDTKSIDIRQQICEVYDDNGYECFEGRDELVGVVEENIKENHECTLGGMNKIGKEKEDMEASVILDTVRMGSEGRNGYLKGYTYTASGLASFEENLRKNFKSRRHRGSNPEWQVSAFSAGPAPQWVLYNDEC